MNISYARHDPYLVGVFADQVGKGRRLTRRLKDLIFGILSANPYLLCFPYDDTETLWRWLVKKDLYPVVKFIAHNASGGARMVRWLMPANQTYSSGATLLTDHTLSLSPRMYNLLVTMTGESLSGINRETRESVLHILVRAKDGEEILKSVVVKHGYDVDPNLIDVHGKSALNYALEKGKADIARMLVEDLGADWQQPQQSQEDAGAVFSNYILASPHSDCLAFLDSCMVKYRIFPNFSVRPDEETEECVICVEDMPVGDRYFMNCCRQYVHSRCLSNNLARATEPVCMLCRADIRVRDSYLYNRIPNTIFKRRWETEELEQMAANTPLPDYEVREETEDEEDEHVVTIHVPYEGMINFGFDDDSLHLPPIGTPPPPYTEDRPRYLVETLNALTVNEQDFREGRRHSMSAPSTSTVTMVVIPSFRSVGSMTTLDGGFDSLSGGINRSRNSFGSLRNLIGNSAVATTMPDNERAPEREILVEYREILI